MVSCFSREQVRFLDDTTFESIYQYELRPFEVSGLPCGVNLLDPHIRSHPCGTLNLLRPPHPPGPYVYVVYVFVCLRGAQLAMSITSCSFSRDPRELLVVGTALAHDDDDEPKEGECQAGLHLLAYVSIRTRRTLRLYLQSDLLS
jgi:hypothetical protein